MFGDALTGFMSDASLILKHDFETDNISSVTLGLSKFSFNNSSLAIVEFDNVDGVMSLKNV